jgi:hypothetical protein
MKIRTDRLVGAWDNGDDGIWTFERLDYTPNHNFFSEDWSDPDEKKTYKLVVIEIAEGDTLEALGDYVKIHAGSGIITTHDTLKNLEKSLPVDLFQRVHRSYIIALDKIRFLEGNRLRIGEQDIPVGQSYRDQLLQYLQKKGANGEG